MKKIIYISNLILLISISTNVKGQNLVPSNLLERIRYFIQLNYKPNNGALSDSCLKSIIYLKFKINKQKIDSVDFSVGIPKLIKDALQKSVVETNKQLKLNNEEIQQVDLKTLLLPVILNYQSGCTPSSVLTFETTGKNTLLNNLSSTRTMYNALANMLNFETGGKYSNLECVIITPLIFGSYF